MRDPLVWKVLTFFSIVLLYLSPVLNMYAIFGEKYLDIYTSYLGVIIFVVAKMTIKMPYPELRFPKLLKVYLYYSLIITIITNINGGSIVYSSLTVIIVFLIYLLYWRTYKNELFIKAYYVITVVSVAFFFLQNIVKRTTGIGISGVISWLPTSKGLAADAAYNQMYVYENFSSFFSEPSHFVQFLVPMLIILLFDKKLNMKRKMVLVTAIIMSLLLAQSGTAMMLAIPVVVFYLYGIWRNNKRNCFISTFLILTIVGIVTFVAVHYLSSNIGNFVGARLTEVTTIDSNDEGTSGFIRMWRGYFVFADFSPIEMLFGTSNHAVILSHVYNSHMELYLEDFALTYFNGIQYILIHTGFIGLFLFLIYIIWLWKNNSLCGRCLIVTMVVLMCIESIYGTSRMAVFLLLSHAQKNN